MQPPPDPLVWNLLTASAGLLAFLLGFFTLIGRERKAPYVINNVLFIFVIVVVGVALDLVSLLPIGHLAPILRQAGLIVLIAAVAVSLFQIFRVFVRLTYFVDHLTFKQIPPFRLARRLIGRLKPRQSYEHDPLDLPPGFAAKLGEFLTNAGAIPRTLDHRSLAIKTKHLSEASGILADLALLFLRENLSVQYLTAGRHPIEFVSQLKLRAEAADLQWGQLKKHLIVIDAYTRHFGFLDSIYPKRTETIQKDGIECVTSSMSFAGIHTASGRAFNVLKKRAGPGAQRSAFLVLYEEPYALADLESAEQYRVFVRHVLPSERQFGGMYTVFTESSIEDRDWRLLTSYADVSLDLATSNSETKS